MKISLHNIIKRGALIGTCLQSVEKMTEPNTSKPNVVRVLRGQRHKTVIGKAGPLDRFDPQGQRRRRRFFKVRQCRFSSFTVCRSFGLDRHGRAEQSIELDDVLRRAAAALDNLSWRLCLTGNGSTRN